MGAANGDITVNHGCCAMDRLGETFIHEGTHITLQQLHDWSVYQRVISKDCGEYYSKYAKDHPEREGMAESFVAYVGLRFRRERLTQQQVRDIISIGPNRMKFFYDNVDETMSRPPMSRPVAFMSAPRQMDENPVVRPLPQADSGSDHHPTAEELEELAAEYLAEGRYLRSIGILNETERVDA